MRTNLMIGLALGGLAAAAPVEAQGTTNPGMLWVGCWESIDGVMVQGRTCVAPEGDRALKLFIIAADQKVTESTLRLDGERVPFTSEGCTGWEQARLTKDGDRLVVDSEVKCEDAPTRKRTTAFVITPAGYWMQVNATGFATASNAQIRAFRPMFTYDGIPVEVRRAVSPFAADGEVARLRIRDHKVSASDLLELEEMGVQGTAIDLVVAAGYPKSFVIDAQGAAAPQLVQPTRDSLSADRRWANSPFYFANGFPMMTTYDMMMLEQCLMWGGISCNMMRGWMGYSGFGYGVGFGGWNNWGWGNGWGGVPVIVRPVSPSKPGGQAAFGGRAVAGRGYTSNGTTTRGAAPRAGTGASAQGYGGASSTAAGSGGSGGGAGAGGGSSSGGGGRTAKPRSP